MLENLYDLTLEDTAFWGDKYVGPEVGTPLPHGGWTLVARYAPESEDADPAEVYLAAAPARFYRVKGKGIDASTGSGERMRYLAHEIAAAIAQGMLAATPES